MRKLLITACALASTWPGMLCAQSSPKAIPAAAGKGTVRSLTVAQTVKTPEIANSISIPVRCDDEGHLYTRTDPFAVESIRKLNAKGELATLFQPNSVTDLKLINAFNFDVDATGKVYQLATAKEAPHSYVLVFKSDGSYQGSIKMDTGFLVLPSSLAIFRTSGALLVAGQKYDPENPGVKLPFTGVLSPSGALLKEIKLKDDDAIRNLGASGDARVTSPEAPNNNRAFSLSQMQAADDGNVYLMRWLSPAIVYAISPGGEVVRRFEIKLDDGDYRPDTMHISGNRMAVLFFQPQTKRQILKVVDLEGHELATYDTGGPGSPGLGGGFACYSSNPEQFTFLESADNDQLEIKVAEPR